VIHAATIQQARHRDAQDRLARYRTEFDLPSGIIHRDGSSLGRLSGRRNWPWAALQARMKVKNELNSTLLILYFSFYIF
jgi:kynureninase